MLSRVASADDNRRAKRLPWVGMASDGADMVFMIVGTSVELIDFARILGLALQESGDVEEKGLYNVAAGQARMGLQITPRFGGERSGHCGGRVVDMSYGDRCVRFMQSFIQTSKQRLTSSHAQYVHAPEP